jgi:hypothetical protein
MSSTQGDPGSPRSVTVQTEPVREGNSLGKKVKRALECVISTSVFTPHIYSLIINLRGVKNIVHGI